MNTVFGTKKEELFSQLGDHAKIVLASSANDIVSARMMSFVIIDTIFYFQTDIRLRKYNDIKNNHNVALCMDNIQIEGICKEIGHPLDNKDFCKVFKKYYNSSYVNYSKLQDERLFVVIPTFIQKWTYVEGKPIIEKFYMNDQEYQTIAYQGK